MFLENYYTWNILIIIATYLGYAIFFSEAFNLTENVAISLSTMMIFAMLIISAFLFKLQFMVVMIYALGLGLFIYYHVRKLDIVRPELWALSAIILVYYFRVAISYYSHYDDMGLWASAARDVYAHDNFPQKGEETLIFSHLYYTRGMSLFQYMHNKLLGISEGHNIFATGLFSILLSTVAFSRRSLSLSMLGMAIILAPSMLLTHNLRSLYLDGAVGFAFGTLVYLILEQQKDRRMLLFCIPFLFVMPQIKEVGFLFSYYALSIYLLNVILFNPNNKLNKMVIIGGIIFLSFIPIISEGLWKAYLSDMGLIQHLKPKLSFMEFYHKLFYSANKEDIDIINAFFANLKQFVFKEEGVIAIYVIMIFSIISVWRYLPAKRYEIIFNYTLVFLCAITYTLFRLSLYFTHFEMAEAVRNASGWRYLSTFMLVIPFISAYYIKSALGNTAIKDKFIKIILPFILIGCSVLIIYNMRNRPEFTLSDKRLVARNIAIQIDEAIKQGADPVSLLDNIHSFDGCLSLRQDLLENKEYSKIAHLCVDSQKNFVKNKARHIADHLKMGLDPLDLMHDVGYAGCQSLQHDLLKDNIEYQKIADKCR